MGYPRFRNALSTSSYPKWNFGIQISLVRVLESQEVAVKQKGNFE